jgi:hypothetical protein
MRNAGSASARTEFRDMASHAQPRQGRPKVLRWVKGVLVFAFVAGLAIAIWLAVDARFYVRQVDVAGSDRLSPSEIADSSGLAGLHILWVRRQYVEAQVLAAIPELQDAWVACELPAMCTITVRERQPRTLWEENGTMWWVDSEGVVVPAQDSVPEAWLIHGPLPRDEEGMLIEAVRIALGELWELAADRQWDLFYFEARGLVFLDERGYPVVVGEGPGMAARLDLLEQVSDEIAARGVTPRYVDVRFCAAPYYSLMNEW